MVCLNLLHAEALSRRTKKKMIIPLPKLATTFARARSLTSRSSHHVGSHCPPIASTIVAYRFYTLHLMSFQHLQSLIQSTITLKHTKLIRSSRTPDGHFLLVSLLTPIRKQRPWHSPSPKRPHHHPAQSRPFESRFEQHHLPSSRKVRK